MQPDYSFVSPIPPQKSGIADYADGLIGGLRALGRTVRVHTQSRYISESTEDVFPFSEFSVDVSPPERTVYHIGNNQHFHDEQILHFMKNGGIAHLHDFSLHHIFAHFTYTGDSEIYYALLQKWYGIVFADSVRDRHDRGRGVFWDSPDVLSHPLHEEVIDPAIAVIVHSHFAQRFIQARFPNKPVYVVPQRYPQAVPLKRAENRPLKACVLGFVDPNKCVDKTIRAIARCRDLSINVELDIAGEIHPLCEKLPTLAEELGVGHQVNFLGKISQEALLHSFKTYDLCIVLRDPTVGETSAIVSRAQQYGMPLIVNDVGSYSELPSFVPKLRLGNDVVQDLSEVLRLWTEQPETYRIVARQAYEYACSEASFDKATQEYDRILQDIRAAT
ncbi:glycosyltransferase family 4 protein [Rhizobium sp. 42MFCr.1]|uniref:glycosyltransferase family 4 protein n=1 Tax=Rhizobium sp. 42MFCr.1 TaxID=1048680 RepID=UPI000370877B|nr:glycosyltransferase [Rhizobium sp. 42MFCr.1]